MLCLVSVKNVLNEKKLKSLTTASTMLKVEFGWVISFIDILGSQ